MAEDDKKHIPTDKQHIPVDMDPRDAQVILEALEEDVQPGGVDDYDAALAAVLSSSLIVGPDPSILDDVKAAPDSAQQLADDTALEAQVNEIYREVMQRAPEHKVQPSLERVRYALRLMGDPQDAYRSIHITGTNGKTSTARMIEAVLREQGLRTGRFTSPHLSTVRERIAIDGHAISPADFVETWEEVKPFIELTDQWSAEHGGPAMSFFEVFTVMAYSAFAMAPIDVAIVEVGMGGQWDATNVITADVAVLMPVDLDHQRWLGSTVEEIATEKLGILKPGKVLVSAEQKPSVKQLIAERVHEQEAKLFYYGKDFELVAREPAVGGQMVTVRTPGAYFEDVPLAMLGAYQGLNAAVALMAVEAFFYGHALSADVVEHALMSTRSPGRLEVVKGSPVVIIDAAHNPHGVTATVEALRESFPGPRVAVYSAFADKDIEGSLGVMEPAFAAVVITQMPGERAADIDDLAEIAREVFGEDRVRVEPELANAIAEAADLAEIQDPDSMAPASVTVLGSIMLAAEARELLGARAVDEAVK
ncbi:MAG: bifunctional folylpolyglutamate synthase/dihydrofolate synthase [Arcanobacterium sp.]|nr:bifunctional folylpolyglutamate synthase/dihydrofolate synthase [Arcanobacterium sp.]MDY5589247.1 folylpolyglutamate synthase/dihydrofolate synthase family protein [Arcanobacterium sp.]